MTDFVEIEFRGERWIVASRPIAPVGIGEAVALASKNGFELPTPDLVDAIWQAADFKVEPITMSPNRGNDPAQFAAHAAKVAAQLEGKSFSLLAGTHKDVVLDSNGKFGLYGWHHLNGVPIQGRGPDGHVFTGHALGFKDYSQGARLVRRATAADRVGGILAGAAIGGAAGGLLFGLPGAVAGAFVGAVTGKIA